jgi:hypothetical protein
MLLAAPSVPDGAGAPAQQRPLLLQPQEEGEAAAEKQFVQDPVQAPAGVVSIQPGESPLPGLPGVAALQAQVNPVQPGGTGS